VRPPTGESFNGAEWDLGTDVPLVCTCNVEPSPLEYWLCCLPSLMSNCSGGRAGTGAGGSLGRSWPSVEAERWRRFLELLRWNIRGSVGMGKWLCRRDGFKRQSTQAWFCSYQGWFLLGRSVKHVVWMWRKSRIDGHIIRSLCILTNEGTLEKNQQILFMIIYLKYSEEWITILLWKGTFKLLFIHALSSCLVTFCLQA